MLNKETCKLQASQYHSEKAFKTTSLLEEENMNKNLGQNTFDITNKYSISQNKDFSLQKSLMLDTVAYTTVMTG